MEGTRLNFGPPGQCDTCLIGWAGLNCDSCGWTGGNCSKCVTKFGPAQRMGEENCTECDTNFGPPGQCDQCLSGWNGPNCTDCDTNFGPPGQCDQCLRGWTGENCSECATKFGPPGQCDTCLERWTGLECNYCDGFGFNATTNCTECIQNGLWTGKYQIAPTYSIDTQLILTFDGPACTNLVPGTYSMYHFSVSQFMLYLKDQHVSSLYRVCIDSIRLY